MSEPDLRRWPVGQVGMVALVGRPNVGKSTLLNHWLNYHLAAVSPTPQTTRRACRGILSDAAGQVIFVDTPGAHEGDKLLNRCMLEAVDQALDDADVLICLADPTRLPGVEDNLIATRVGAAAADKAVFLVLNKSDLATPEQRQATVAAYRRRLGAVPPEHAISALTGAGLPELLAAVRAKLPRGPFLYDPDQVTDAFERDVGAELIREAAMALLRDELPHCLAVEVEKWDESGPKLRVGAKLHVERDSQKAIVIGHGGTMIHDVRVSAERSLHQVFERPVKLELHVKVSPDWRNQRGFLKHLGLAGQA